MYEPATAAVTVANVCAQFLFAHNTQYHTHVYVVSFFTSDSHLFHFIQRICFTARFEKTKSANKEKKNQSKHPQHIA